MKDIITKTLDYYHKNAKIRIEIGEKEIKFTM